MGVFNKLARWLGFDNLTARILVIGLDNSGKTTLINNLKEEKSKLTEIAPTVGFTLTKILSENGEIDIDIFDMSGQGKYRNLWEHYYSSVDALMFVIDSSDPFRLVVVGEELDMLMKNKKFRSNEIPMIFITNKIDKTGSLNSTQISEKLNISQIVSNSASYQFIETNGLTGDGIQGGLDWLIQKIRLNKK
ncbi:ADP-ribosylation factor-like protein 6 [Intoshia linei]|uniref:ADP-ribosylation factor-like protein 6 n=1 Tax=Intoshia linei TaxID=1819745 RepID=A0A177BER9_9BILA|nr:ADP-ribosylation factor-like protein 6 [Intoshia linei]